jgi:hypothetical protein
LSFAEQIAGNSSATAIPAKIEVFIILCFAFTNRGLSYHQLPAKRKKIYEPAEFIDEWIAEHYVCPIHRF